MAAVQLANEIEFAVGAARTGRTWNRYEITGDGRHVDQFDAVNCQFLPALFERLRELRSIGQNRIVAIAR